MNVDLSHVLCGPCFRAEWMSRWMRVDCVRAGQVVVKPQVINRRAFSSSRNWRASGDEHATSAGRWSLKPLTSSIRTIRGES
jgi:hypothetical protein